MRALTSLFVSGRLAPEQAQTAGYDDTDGLPTSSHGSRTCVLAQGPQDKPEMEEEGVISIFSAVVAVVVSNKSK